MYLKWKTMKVGIDKVNKYARRKYENKKIKIIKNNGGNLL